MNACLGLDVGGQWFMGYAASVPVHPDNTLFVLSVLKGSYEMIIVR